MIRLGYDDIIIPESAVFVVTGGAGFIGSNICEALLKRRCQVRCIDDLSVGNIDNIKSFLDNPLFSWHHETVLNYDACRKICEGADYVTHQAAWGSVPRSILLPLQYEEINIRGTLNMMEAARQAKVKTFVYASSSAVYGDSAVSPKKEGDEGRLLSPYALTKQTNEEYGKLYYTLYGLNTIGLRYFNVFGKRQDPSGSYAAVIPQFIDLLLRGKQPTIYGDGEQTRDFVFVENVVEANLKACLAGETAFGKCYNVAYGESEKLIDIFYYICKLLNVQMEPAFAGERAGDIKHSSADISEARRHLGFDPGYSFKHGLALTIDWYRSQC